MVMIFNIVPASAAKIPSGGVVSPSLGDGTVVSAEGWGTTSIPQVNMDSFNVQYIVDGTYTSTGNYVLLPQYDRKASGQVSAYEDKPGDFDKVTGKYWNSEKKLLTLIVKPVGGVSYQLHYVIVYNNKPSKVGGIGMITKHDMRPA
jgi:hypothetical protein